ncbi:DUF2079 domain-containing protein [Nonomuraea endophytica]|uniref:Putative membrane protein n=1 Tax=Nonomuraea endophytica TaxID=714136 RepID=A0A7W7ZZP0_9ACTN|nr:DUF2079 domain-containing protein [Nonomuraea endophytica]MBB5076813.1 putative membrane protein [Nonomuraea endophytica]
MGGDVPGASRREWWGIWGIAGVAAVVYSVLSFVRVHSLKAGTYDLVIFDQAVRAYSDFRLPIAIVKGVHNDFGAGFSVLGDHWSPILALLAPLYWLHDGPETLLIAQSALLAAAAVPLWVFARRALGTGAAYAVAIAYTLSWPVAEAVAFDFHEAAFVPLLTAVMLERWQAGRKVAVVLAALALLCVKEDMGLLVAGFGLVLLTRAGWRVLGGGFVLSGVAFTGLASQVLIPAFGGRPDYYWAYGALGDGVSSAVRTIVTDPLTAFGLLGTPPVKLVTLLLLLGVSVLAALGSPLVLMAVPLLAERMLASSFPNWWVPEYHYNAFLVVVIFAAGVDAVRRFERLRKVWVAGIVVFALATVPFFALAQLGDPGSYRRDPRELAAARAVATVPDGALVEVANNLGPLLTGRARVLLLDRTPRWAPWVVVEVGRRVFPFKDAREQSERLDALVAAGYQIRFRQDAYVVLHRPGPDPKL